MAKRKKEAEVDVGLPIPIPSGGYLNEQFATISPPIDPRIILNTPVQTGMNAPEGQAMDPFTTWASGKAIDLIAEKTGMKERGSKLLTGLLEMFSPEAQAAESPAMPAVQAGFQPTTSVVAQDVTPAQRSAMNYVPDDQIPMEGRRLPTREQILIRQDWEGPGRGLAQGDTLPDGTMPVNMDGELVSTAASLLQKGAASMQDVGQRAVAELQDVANPQTPTTAPPRGGFFDSLKGFLGDEERMANLAIAFNTMRLNPDATLAAAMEKRIERAGARRQANRTADVLLDRGLITPDQAEAMRSGALTYKDIMGGESIAKYKWLLENPEAAAKLKEIGVLSSGTNITIGDKGETKLQEEIGKGLGTKITEDFNAGTQARSALDSVELLMGLSENLESATSIPPALRNLVPEGVSDPIDAYRGVMTNVAKSLRIKGEGTMSDRDIDLLIRQAGPVTSNPQARRVMQEALKRKAEINLQLSKAASDFMLERINKQQYLDRVSQINDIPLMDDNMRSYISSLGGGAAKPAGGQIEVISVIPGK